MGAPREVARNRHGTKMQFYSRLYPASISSLIESAQFVDDSSSLFRVQASYSDP
jgi:hypothetical protein